MKKFCIVSIAALAMLLTASCGYHMGSTMHPQIHNIGIGKVINDTAIYNASVQLQQQLAEQFGVSGIPTLVVMRNGEVVSRSTGAKPKAQILAMLEE